MRQCKKNQTNKQTADTAERCGILVWTQFSAVCLLSCNWPPGSLAEGVRLSVSDRLAQDSLGLLVARISFRRQRRPGLTNAPLQAAFMCHLMRKPPA